MASVVAACGDDTGTEARTEEEPVELALDVERAAPASDAPVAELVTGLHQFTVDFAREADGGDEAGPGNMVFSPTSIGVAFAMASAGADDATAEALAEVFGFPAGDDLHEAINSLAQELDAANGEDVIVELANSTWVQDGVEVGRPFLETLAAYYDNGVQITDFAGDVGGSRERINAWVAERTRDRITQLLGQDALSPETVAVLVNAVYLKAAWADQFMEGDTTEEPFHLADGSTVDVPTMHHGMLASRATQGEVAGVGYTAVELPYKGRELSMVVVVPDEGARLADLEAGLDGEALGAIGDDLTPAVIDLALPRWDMASELDLAEPLGSLGAPVPGGDMSGVAPGVRIDAAVHAADITVDEEGTEAAAATAVMETTGAPVMDDILTVTVDRPFLFLLRHDETSAPLFYGRVADPRG